MCKLSAIAFAMDPPSAKRGKVGEKTAEQRRASMDRRNTRDRERRRAETPEQTRVRLEKRRAKEKAKREAESDQQRESRYCHRLCS